MKKNVWILNHYAGRAGRHYGFATYLKEAGYSPMLFCANTQINSLDGANDSTGRIWSRCEVEESNVSLVYVKVREYVGNGKSRILNMVDFYKNVKKASKEVALEYGKPDIIYASSVHPLTLLAGQQIAKKYHVEFICEIRDLWPESLVEYGIAGKYNPLVIGLRMLEKWLYYKADRIIFTAGGFYDYILEQKWENIVDKSKIYQINNGIDIEQFNQNKELYTIEDSDLDNTNLFKIVYAGSIKKVNNLGLLLDIAKEVENKKVKFLIWGDGNELPMLKKRVKDENITNVIFKGRVEKKYVPYIVSKADLNIAHNNPSKLFRFGISFNKIFDYLAAGKPVLCDFPSKYNPVIENNAGFEAINPDPKAIASLINDIINFDSNKYDQICQNALEAAKKYDYKKLTESLISIIEQSNE